MAAQTYQGGLPFYVQNELRRYLDCGIVACGFARACCSECGASMLVAFSWKTRGVCCSCGARRTAQTAANLVNRLLSDVPLRHWVLSAPFDLRLPMARDATLLSAVLRIFCSEIDRGAGRNRSASALARPFARVNRSASALARPFARVHRSASALARPLTRVNRSASAFARPLARVNRSRGALTWSRTTSPRLAVALSHIVPTATSLRRPGPDGRHPVHRSGQHRTVALPVRAWSPMAENPKLRRRPAQVRQRQRRPWTRRRQRRHRAPWSLRHGPSASAPGLGRPSAPRLRYRHEDLQQLWWPARRHRLHHRP